MEKEFFQWEKYAEEKDNLAFPIDAMGEIFLINVKENMMWLSEKCAELFDTETEDNTAISVADFEQRLLESSRHAFRQAIQRIANGKSERVSCHVAFPGKNGYLSSVIYLYRLKNSEDLFGYISIDYEPMREYEQHLEDMIKQLRHAQMVNELIVEGASDYIYQLDLVNNICTFSSKALEVLPLETPTFSDAMNKVLSFIVPEDRQIFLGSFTPFLTGQSDRHVAEYRVMTKQGNIMWISCQGKGIHDEEGRPVMIAGSLLDITEQKKEQERVEKMLYYDEMTGLKNRICFERDLTEQLKIPAAKGSILYMNIRKFKLYNELFGHSFGDKVLKEFAYMLNLYFADSYGIYRLSGDEFLIHLKESTREQILQKLIPLQGVLKKTRDLDGHKVYINACIAIVLYPEHGDTIEELMNNAHQCLYRITREGKDEISFFTEKVGNNDSQQFLLENEMRKDMEQKFRHFRVVYQPIVHVRPDGSEWIGAEALLRYSNPAFAELNQMEMIHTLEYSGLILPVGRWVIAQAVHECSKWNRNGNGNNSIVHVNISAQQVSDAGLITYIKDLCEEEEFSPSSLVVELTETSLLNNFEVAVNFCKELLKLGVGVALDDFGAGYSSFNYLRHLPITEIKIDREFTRQLQDSHYKQTFISFVHQLSKELKVGLCVEGVETKEELEVLEKMGIDTIQGFYFERPMEADVISREFPGRKTRE